MSKEFEEWWYGDGKVIRYYGSEKDCAKAAWGAALTEAIKILDKNEEPSMVVGPDYYMGLLHATNRLEDLRVKDD